MRVSALSTRWKQLPYLLTNLYLRADDFKPRTGTLVRSQLNNLMDLYTETINRLLAPTGERAIKVLRLRFFLTDPHLESVGSMVTSVLERGHTKYLEFIVVTELHDVQCDEEDNLRFGQRFLKFFGPYPLAFRQLRSLCIQNMRFSEYDMPNLLNACDQLQRLCIESCDSGRQSVLRIDAPRSRLVELVFEFCGYAQIELVRVPKLLHVVYDTWMGESPPIVFGHVPSLRSIDFGCAIMHWQPPFMLSKWLSGTRLETVSMDFHDWMIWIKPEDPKTAPTYLQQPDGFNFFLTISRHVCGRNGYVDNAEKVSVSWESSSSGFKHCNLKLLDIVGFEMDCKMMKYIRLVMGCATRLRMFCLHDKELCDKCDAMHLEAPSGSSFPVDEGDKNLVREHLTDGFSSAIEIVIE
ncbi:unnamed protein product [Urochloa decumbens]|uniref:F-box/LRR-repeat protein 15/At3g58940/PEG3-like LRR domain-containing protein n=1 Tax=Urochloa decumbens TaxID=240449 RepID=A0ABC8X5S8_9POAL